VTVVVVTRLGPVSVSVSDMAGFRLGDLHPVPADAAASGHREPRDRAVTDPAVLDLEVRECRARNRGSCSRMSAR
jgi:hypothetical protein